MDVDENIFLLEGRNNHLGISFIHIMTNRGKYVEVGREDKSQNHFKWKF